MVSFGVVTVWSSRRRALSYGAVTVGSLLRFNRPPRRRTAGATYALGGTKGADSLRAAMVTISHSERYQGRCGLGGGGRVAAASLSATTAAAAASCTTPGEGRRSTGWDMGSASGAASSRHRAHPLNRHPPMRTSPLASVVAAETAAVLAAAGNPAAAAGKAAAAEMAAAFISVAAVTAAAGKAAAADAAAAAAAGSPAAVTTATSVKERLRWTASAPPGAPEATVAL